jgi:hypothetical protein
MTVNGRIPDCRICVSAPGEDAGILVGHNACIPLRPLVRIYLTWSNAGTSSRPHFQSAADTISLPLFDMMLLLEIAEGKRAGFGHTIMGVRWGTFRHHALFALPPSISTDVGLVLFPGFVQNISVE